MNREELLKTLQEKLSILHLDKLLTWELRELLIHVNKIYQEVE